MIMSGACIKMIGNKQTTIQHISNIIKNDINAELVSESLRTSDSMNVILLTFEKYYFRNGSMHCDEPDASINIHIIERIFDSFLLSFIRYHKHTAKYTTEKIMNIYIFL